MPIHKQRDMFTENNHTADRLHVASTFIDNMKLPIHRWFRYSAGFAAEWVQQEIQQARVKDAFFDPFAGSGTALLAAQECGVPAIGLEAHPFVARIARTKTRWRCNPDEFRAHAAGMIAIAKKDVRTPDPYPKLIVDCFPPNILMELDALKRAWLTLNDGSIISELCWLALTAILRVSSPVGTSQMELIQPKKQKSNPVRPFDAFQSQIEGMYHDIHIYQNLVSHNEAIVYQGDARNCDYIHPNSVELIITSPPYINNFDYADATRFEMTFWGEVQGWGDLQDNVRKYLVRSCAQHMSPKKDVLEELLADKAIQVIAEELLHICLRLSQERLLHGGKKNYHLMVAAYFVDLAHVWHALRRVCTQQSRICFVIGDSAPYGVYVPVHELLGKLALYHGFSTFRFTKTRDRNTKWKNRKHKVPLSEGQLWVSADI